MFSNGFKRFTHDMTSALQSNTLLYLLKFYKSQHDVKVISNRHWQLTTNQAVSDVLITLTKEQWIKKNIYLKMVISGKADAEDV